MDSTAKIIDIEEVRERHSAIPNGESLNFIYKVASSGKNGRKVNADTDNPHEKVTIETIKNNLAFVRENTQTNTVVTVMIKGIEKYQRGENKSLIKALPKMLLFALQKMTDQHFTSDIGFDLQELVELGMYGDIHAARHAVKNFFEQQSNIIIAGKVKKGKRVISESGGVLFYHLEIENNYVVLTANNKFNFEFIAPYFTIFPQFAYALKSNAFSLVRYIFFRARQEARAIKDKGKFNIRLESVRENLGLPSVGEVKSRQYKQLIIEPIKNAIKEIEDSLAKECGAEKPELKIKLHTIEGRSIQKWLEGYLEIELTGDFAKTFIRIAKKAEDEQAKWDEAKRTELAKIEAKKELKEQSKSRS